MSSGAGAGEYGGPVFLWRVDHDLIDLDRWARSYIAIRVDEKRQAGPQATRWWFWPGVALVLVVLALTSSFWLTLGLATWVAFTVLGAPLWNQGAARRLAKRLHALPAALEPFVLRAEAAGTQSHSNSGSDRLAWSRYQSVRLYEDLVVLTHETGMMRFLPTEGLASGQSPTTAVETISAWIDQSRSGASLNAAKDTVRTVASPRGRSK